MIRLRQVALVAGDRDQVVSELCTAFGLSVCFEDPGIVWRIDLDDIRARLLHPRDVGGAIVSLDEPRPNGAWRWAGPWRGHDDTSVVTSIAGVDIGADDPDAMRARWAEVGIDHAVRFVPAGDRGEGIDAIDLVATDRRRAGDEVAVGGVTLRLV